MHELGPARQYSSQVFFPVLLKPLRQLNHSQLANDIGSSQMLILYHTCTYSTYFKFLSCSKTKQTDLCYSLASNRFSVAERELCQT